MFGLGQRKVKPDWRQEGSIESWDESMSSEYLVVQLAHELFLRTTRAGGGGSELVLGKELAAQQQA